MTNGLSSTLARRPLLTAVVYTGTCLLPLALVSAQILQLEEEIGFRVGQLGLATAAYFGAAALGANPAGRVVARLGPGRSLRIGALLTVAACLIAGTAVIWWVIPLATAVGGMGNGLTQVASNLAIFDGVARERQGVGFGAKQAAVPLASVLAGISLPVIGLVFGWRWVFALAGLIALTLAFSALISTWPGPRRETKGPSADHRDHWYSSLSGASQGRWVAMGSPCSWSLLRWT